MVPPKYTLLGTNISPEKSIFEDDFPFPKVGYVSSLEGIIYIFMYTYINMHFNEKHLTVFELTRVMIPRCR